MRCPACGCTESKVIDSRPTDNGSIRRRRECENCRKRFSTYEIIDYSPIMVVKKDGSKQLFDKNKLKTGILKACYKRPISEEQIDGLINDVEAELFSSLDKDHSSQEIGYMVMERLKKLDDVSYVRFASVYKEFKDIESFVKELSNFINKES